MLLFLCTCSWAKFNIFETGAHIPLIIRTPWLPHSVGQHTSVLAEAVDLYPTMAALCGLPPPQEYGQEVNGTNLKPLFEKTSSQGSGDELKPQAFSLVSGSLCSCSCSCFFLKTRLLGFCCCFLFPFNPSVF